jgi:putative endonuclease
MKKWNREKGGRGEKIAEKFLKKKGYKIVEKNWGNKFGEIDLIGVEEETVVFVEVKMKSGDEFGSPEEMVGRKKMEQIRRMAEVYLMEKGGWKRYIGFRIDIVCISGKEGEEEIRHYEGVEM